MISDVLLAALGLGVVTLLLTAALSPLETLSWWAGWTEEELGAAPPPVSKSGGGARHYIVYLSGIGSISGRYLLPREKAFLRALRERVPGAVIVSDVFPYSPQGLPLLAAPRLFDQLWRRVQALRVSGAPSILAALIKARNVFQVMVSADHRYGPIFNQGAAGVIEAALVKEGYRRDSGAAITIIGYSGGAQVATGAAPFLRARLKAPIDVISLGGVMASDPGLAYLRAFHHIYGARDKVERVGALMFPDRWAAAAYSEWNAGKRDGRITLHKLPRMTHTGVNGYFGRVPIDGVANVERTLEKVSALIKA